MPEPRGSLISVDRSNAFRVNQIGLAGASFPLSIEVSNTDGITVAAGTAIRAADLVELLADNAGQFAAILNLGQASWLGPGLMPVPAGEIAVRQQVPAGTHDITWAWPAGAGRNDLLTIRWADLGRFFTGWSLYDVDIIDLGNDLTGFEPDELALSVGTRGRDLPLLHQIPGASVFYAGHDDCYFHIESTDPGLPARLLARLLALIAGSTLLGETTGSVTIPEPEPSMTAGLLQVSPCWTGTLTGRQHAEPVTIRLAAAPWRPTATVPASTAASITFDPRSGRWTTLPYASD